MLQDVLMPLAWFSLCFFFVFATGEQLRPFKYNHPQDYPILPASYLLILQKECPFFRPGKERAGTKGQGPFENQEISLSFCAFVVTITNIQQVNCEKSIAYLTILAQKNT
jgi:hypothetical protein